MTKEEIKIIIREVISKMIDEGEILSPKNDKRSIGEIIKPNKVSEEKKQNEIQPNKGKDSTILPKKTN